MSFVGTSRNILNVFKAVAGVMLVATVTGGAAETARSGGPVPAPAAAPLVEARDERPGDKDDAKKPKGSPNALLGSPDFYPSPERPVGWRGDWTGHFPGATPPIEFGRWAKTPVRDLKFQIGKPKDDKEPASAKPLTSTGSIPEMLCAGPFEVKDGVKPADFEAIPNEANLQPNDGDSAGDLKWSAVAPDFKKIEKGRTSVGYWHSWFFSKTGGGANLWLVHAPGTRVWLNGKQIYTCDAGRDGNSRARAPMTIQAGWNRLLFKSGAYFRASISMVHPVEYETKNIVWMTKMPGHTTSTPIHVGDRIFTMSEPSDIVCINKADGKIRWMKTLTYFDAKPDKEAEPLLAEIKRLNDEIIKQINASVSPTGPSTAMGVIAGGLKQQRYQVERKVQDRIKAVDEPEGKRLNAWEQGQPGWACATPCSDGRNLYCLFMNGCVVCFDLDGKQKWIQKIDFPGNRHHGYSSSPILSKGKFIVLLGPTMRAYDCETGKFEWETPIRQLTWGSLVPVKWGGVDAVLSTEGACAAVADGRELQKTGRFGGSIVPTPALDPKSNMLFGITWRGTKTGFAAIVPPAGAGASSEKFWNMPEYDVMTLKADHAGGTVASALVVDGLCYYVSSGAALNVVDVATGKLVYKKLLDLNPMVGYVEAPGISANPCYAGKNIYIMDNTGNILIFQPGREFNQVALNTLQHIVSLGNQYESQEQVWTTPVFEGSRMYVRGDYMFCIGEK